MSALQAVSAWLLSLIISAAPPGRKSYHPEAQETVDEAKARYGSIVNDMVEVLYDPSISPLFQGPTGRARTAAVVASIMSHEGSFLKNVDYGLGKYAKGDHGRSWCLMQINIGNGRTMRWDTIKGRPAAPNNHSESVFEGYTGEELIADRKLCIQEGLKILAVSFGGTQGLPILDRLRVYASGSRDKGGDASKSRMQQAIWWYSKTYPHGQLTDADVMADLMNAHKVETPNDNRELTISLLDTTGIEDTTNETL